jgi:dihydrodipicolinate reductase
MNITLLGAGGKMGGRITANLRNLPKYHVDYVEASEARQKQLADAGIRTASMEEALGFLWMGRAGFVRLDGLNLDLVHAVPQKLPGEE